MSHPAVRLFVSHGGWNSVLESMLAGKPLLVWPQFAEQKINAHRIEHDWGMGRSVQSTAVTSEEWTNHLSEIFSHEDTYLAKARLAQQMIVYAKRNSSRLHLQMLLGGAAQRKIEL